MNKLIKEILQSQKVHDKDGTPIDLNSAINSEEGLFIQNVMDSIKPKHSIEVGCAYGISSLFIAEKMTDDGSTHTIIDPYQNSQWLSIGLLNLKRAGLDRNVQFFEQLSYIALSELIKEGRRFQFAFIDGWHTFDYTFVDFFLIDKMLDVGGVIIFDDAHWPAIDKVLRYIVRNLPYEVFGPIPQKHSRKREIVGRAIRLVPHFEEIFAQRLVNPGHELGFYKRGYVALRKIEEDILGTHPNERRWDFHRDF